MKLRIKVMPDHMSSGLWNEATHAMMDVDEFLEGTFTRTDTLALKYWHEVWEFFITEGKATLSYQSGWNEDGQALVDQWNKQQDVYEFVYQPEWNCTHET